MINERRIRKDLERGVMTSKEISWHFPGENGENREKPEASQWPLSPRKN
jgi:hypothetical protein